MKTLALVLLVAACGGGSTTPAAAPTTPEAAAAPANTTDYTTMTFAERKAYMKAVVLPKARELFATIDPKFQTMDCVTCHGDTAKDGTFKMPNPKIKPLPGTEEAFMAWIGKDAEAAKWTKFMAEQLEPAMAQLVKKTPFNPTTKTGDFSCGACHTMQK